jgi:precorrin-8X/cobalt-precorrin-8 methylmutase
MAGEKYISPQAIEQRSFEIISELLGDRIFPAPQDEIIKRVIHTTADFDYADNLKISEHAVEGAIAALKTGCNIVCDTKMAAAGINKKALAVWGGTVSCYIDDAAIANEAEKSGRTRASLSMEKAARDPANQIFAVGNAPTALIKLADLIAGGVIKPALVIGVPVGFVNVVEAKEYLMQTAVPQIVAVGRKGGSNVAAAIVNAILYRMINR